MAFLIPAISAVGSIWGDINQNNQNKQMDATINQVMGNAQNVQNQELSGIQGLQNTANQYTGLIPGLASTYGNELSGAGALAPGAASQYMQNAMNPNSLYGQTGVNVGNLTQTATNYLSNPGATNLSGISPGVMSTFANQMANGLNPQVQSNAMNQLNQQFQQSNNQIQSNLAPGQNASAMQLANQNNLLQNSTNLAGNLAGQNQQARVQGAQGLEGAAGTLDAQTQQMLTAAQQMGLGYNQTVLGNQAAGAGFGQNMLGQLQNFANTGNQMNEFATGQLGSLGQTLGQEGEYYSGLAAGAPASQNPFSMLGGVLSNFSGMGGGGGGGGVDQSSFQNYNQNVGIPGFLAGQGPAYTPPPPQLNY